MVKIEYGFSDQRLIVYPFYAIEQALNNPLVTDSVIHSMGYFPRVEGHCVDRVSGCGEYLLIYYAREEGWYVLDGKRYAVSESHFPISPAEKPHQYGSSGHDPWYIYWAHLKGKKAKYIGNQLRGVIPIDMDDNSHIDDRIAFFDGLLNVLESGTDEVTVNYVNLSLNHLITFFLYMRIYREAKFSKGRAENTFFISLMAHLMTENLENKLTLKELASYLDYSESYMYRLLFKETGYASVNYFLYIRIGRACQLLLYANMKTSQTTLKLGFDDPYYFSRIFKKIVDTSSKDYRHSLPKWDIYDEPKRGFKAALNEGLGVP